MVIRMKSIFIPASLRDETLKTVATQGKRLLEPWKSFAMENNVPIQILEDHAVENEVEVHRHEGDLWICLEGEVEFIVGGAMVDPWLKKNPDGTEDSREVKAKEIKNGVTYILHERDVLWIPAGDPHKHNAKETARLYVIKIPAGEEYPLEKVAGFKTHP